MMSFSVRAGRPNKSGKPLSIFRQDRFFLPLEVPIDERTSQLLEVFARTSHEKISSRENMKGAELSRPWHSASFLLTAGVLFVRSDCMCDVILQFSAVDVGVAEKKTRPRERENNLHECKSYMRIAPGPPARLCKCRRSLTFTAKRIHKIIASSGGTFWVSRRSGCSSSQCKARWRHSLSTSLIIAFLVRFLSPAPSRQETGEEEAESDVREQKKLRLHAWIFPPHHRLVCFRHQLLRPHAEARSVTRDGTAARRGKLTGRMSWKACELTY